MSKFKKYSSIDQLKDHYNVTLIYEAVMGSHAYGTNTPESDVDIKGVYIVSRDEYITGNYKDQIEVDADTVYYEFTRFLHLLKSANPTVLEMLFVGEENITYKSHLMDNLLDERNKFITQKCKLSFGGFGVAQLKKAKGLNKKMNYEKHFIVEKTIIDFCYVLDPDRKFAPKLYKEWVKTQETNIQEDLFGLVRLDHTNHLYTMYYDWQSHYKGEGIRPGAGVDDLGYKGICNKSTLLVSSVPKYSDPIAVLSWNVNAWSEYKKKHSEYNDWLNNRNVQRYVDVKNHNQKIDGKNLLHAVRLVNVAIDIGEGKGMIVKRPESKYLLNIRKGKYNLEEIMIKTSNDIKKLNDIFDNNINLPKDVSRSLTDNLIIDIYG